ncbi:hypothetical protein Tco_1418634 [Tanacetum coccineum]
MVACLEKTEGNSEFHEILDFLTSSLIHHALTVSPTIYISYIKQFWNTARSQTVNDEKQIHATVDSKAVVVTEASIRGSLLLNDGCGHTSNRAEGGLNLEELLSLCAHLAHRVLTLETTKDAQVAEVLTLQARIKKLENKCKPNISHYRAWLKSVKRLSMKKRLGKKEYVSKQGRKKAKPGLTLDDSTFDDLDVDLAHGMDYMETEEAMDEGRQSKENEELNVTRDTKVLEKGGSNKEPVNIAGNIGVSTVVLEVSIVNVSTASRLEVSTATPMTPPTTTSVFEDEDIFLVDALVMLSDKTKLKGVAIKEIEEYYRLAISILTSKPLPTIDPKDKGKGVLKESPVKKVKRSDLDAAQIAKDAEVARLVYEEELAELEREKEERQRQEQASLNYIANLYDEVQARIDDDHELAVSWTQEEQEKYTVDERAKLLAEYFDNRKKQLAEERAAAIKKKPPTRTQLRSLMMTYLKHTGRYKHSQLKKKTLEEIQALYIKEQERASDFVPIGSEEDKRLIEKMNKRAAGEGTSKKRKGGSRMKRKSKRIKTDSDIEEEEHLKTFLKIVPNEEGEVDNEVLDKRYPIVDWKSEFYHTDRYGEPHDYYRVFRADGSSRYIKTFTKMVSRFDRLDFIELHSLVMKKFETTTPEVIDLIL